MRGDDEDLRESMDDEPVHCNSFVISASKCQIQMTMTRIRISPA